MSDEIVRLDWRGLPGPEPILKTARKLRDLRGSDAREVHVLSDDAGFPDDMKRWCQSAGIHLTVVEEVPQGFVAIISLEQREKPSKEIERAPPTPSASEGMIETLDCVGLICPEPILKAARRVRKMGMGTLDVVCDDPDFVRELKTWIKKSSAEIVSIQELGQGRVRARLLARPRPSLPRPSPAERDESPTRRTDRFPGSHTGTTQRSVRVSQRHASALERPLASAKSACFLIVRDDRATASAALAAVKAAITKGHRTSIFFAFDGALMLEEGGSMSADRLGEVVRAGARIMVCEETFAALDLDREGFGPSLPFVVSSMGAFIDAAEAASVSLVF